MSIQTTYYARISNIDMPVLLKSLILDVTMYDTVVSLYLEEYIRNRDATLRIRMERLVADMSTAWYFQGVIIYPEKLVHFRDIEEICTEIEGCCNNAALRRKGMATASVFEDFRFNPVAYPKYKTSLSSWMQELQDGVDYNTAVPTRLTEEEIHTRMVQWLSKEDNLRTRLTLHNITQELGLSRTALYRYLIGTGHKDFRTWKTEIRIEMAKRYLLDSEEFTTVDVADKVGFQDKSNFYRQFHRFVGCTPKEYRLCNGDLVLLDDCLRKKRGKG